MKLLHVLAQLPCGTGSGIYFTNLVKELAPYGHEQCAVFALQDDCTFPHLPADRQFPVRFRTDALPFPVAGMSDVMPYESTVYSRMDSGQLERWKDAFRQALREATARFRPDVLVLHHLWILTSLALERFPHAKSIAICHNTDLRQAKNHPELRKRHVTGFERLDQVLTLSDAVHGDIRAIYRCEPVRIATLGGGYDSTLFFPARERRKPGPVRILYAGKIDPSKGIFQLLRAFAALCGQDPLLELTVIGNAHREHREQFDRLVGANGHIRALPSMPQEALAAAMREHDLFVMPSFYEGLGLIAIEALACGLRTVSTENEGLASLLGRPVVDSEAIEFVALPPMAGVGVPQASHLDRFTQELGDKLRLQIGRVRRGEPFPAHVGEAITAHSWSAIAARVNALLPQ